MIFSDSAIRFCSIVKSTLFDSCNGTSFARTFLNLLRWNCTSLKSTQRQRCYQDSGRVRLHLIDGLAEPTTLRSPVRLREQLHSFFMILVLANFSCHLLTFVGAFASSSCKINSIVSSILEIVVRQGCGMKVSASSPSAAIVVEF